jgi:capsular exopolysaccharide synthesis family protein
MEKSSAHLDFAKLLRVVRRRGPIVLLCALAAAAAAFAFAKTQRKQYTATATILYQNQQLQQQAAGLPVVQVSNPQTEADTNLKLATLPRVVDTTAAALGVTSSEIQHQVNVSQVGDTKLLAVAATAGSPHRAARIANTYARQAIAYYGQSGRAYFANALRAVNLQYQSLSPAQQRGPQGTDLKSRAASLQVLAQLQGSTLQFAQPATPPTAPSSPKTKVDTVVGGFLGLLLGLAIAFGLERFDRRVRDPSDLEEAYRLPLVGVVPESPALRNQGARGSEKAALPAREAEVFALLRAHIRYFNVDRRLRVIVIVSAAPQDGKSTVARNLTLAAASAGDRVLLLEADLRRPSAAKALGISQSPGLAGVLLDGIPLEEATQSAEVPVGHHTVSVDVLVAGGILPPNPAQVTESHAMEALLDDARSTYDLVVIDTPPLNVLSDAFPLLRIADGVVIVSRLDRNNRDVAERLRATLETSGAPMIGVVANGYRQRGATPYGYGYKEKDAGRTRERPRGDETNGSAPSHAERELERRAD